MINNFKRFFCILIIMLLAVSSFSVYNTAMADDFGDSKSYILVDENVNEILLSKDEKLHLPIASMCKVMTLVLCFDAINNNQIKYNDEIVVSEKASSMGGSQVFLEANGNYTVDNLIKSIVVASANDACVAMAETIAGSEERFVEMMNSKAKNLGMNDTVFTNATGLPEKGQYSCALDVAKMFSALIKNNDYFNYSKIWMDKIYHPKGNYTEIANTNKMIRFYNGCDGGKTGHTSEAGFCLVSTVKRNNLRFISVVISSSSSKDRFKEASNLFNYGYSNYELKNVINKNDKILNNIEVLNGKKDYVDISSDRDYNILIKKGTNRVFDIKTDLIKSTNAPVKINDVLGKITVYENNIEICSFNIISNEDIELNNYFDNIKKICNNWNI